MEAITFSPAQVHVFNLVSHIKSELGLEKLRAQLAAFYAKQGLKAISTFKYD